MSINKRILKLLLPVLLVLAGMIYHGTAIAQADPPLVQQYNQRGIMKMNHFNFEEARYWFNLADKEKENASSLYYLGRMKLMANEWDSACYFFEKSLQLNPANTTIYPELYRAYLSGGKWKKAEEIAQKVTQAEPNGDPKRFEQLETLLGDAGRSPIIIVLALLILAGLFFYPVYKGEDAITADPGNIRVTEILFISATVSCILYLVFYAISPWVINQNLHDPPYDYTLAIRGYSFEHDGIESFVMYLLMFANLFLTLLLVPRLVKLKINKGLYLPVFVCLFIVTGYYFFKIGFYPPFTTVDTQYIFVPILLGALAVGMYFLYQKSKLFTKVIVILICAYCGLITLAPPSSVDLMYIFAPALRLYYGFKVSDIYFQYDLFLSFLAFVWMKFNIALELFPYLGTLSFFLFFIGSFFFMDKYMKTKGLSAIFIIAMILVRIYIQGYDDPFIFQVAPLRLDLWLILLLVANWKGVHHWSVAMVVGLLVLFHRNLGLIYMGSYAELLIALCLVDVLTLVPEKTFSIKAAMGVFMKHLRLNLVNIGIIIASIALCFILFHELFSPSAVTYRKIGVGMLPVAPISFYWYVPVMLSTLVALLYFFRKKLGERYVSVGLFIALLAIGNSMYFFGRSHENNVLNIAGVIVFALFTLFDTLIFLSPQQQAPAPVAATKDKSKKVQAEKKSYFTLRNIAWALPILFIVMTSYTYSNKTAYKLKTQYNNLLESNFVFPYPFPYMDTAAVRVVTHNDQNVFILDPFYDFYFYYYGKYKPLGQYNPMAAWIYKKDMLQFIQGLLDKHYYVVYNSYNTNTLTEYIADLKFNHMSQVRDMVALSQEPIPLLLPPSQASVYHVALQDSLLKNGMDYNALKMDSVFTIEFIVKPSPQQVAGACIANNLSQFQYDGLRGFTFQYNNAPDQFLFGFSNGTPTVPFTAFHLDANRWNYVGVTVTRDVMKVFVNGKPAGTINTNGVAKPNSELPLTLGNRNSRDAKFNGYIREVNISNGTLDDAELISRGQKVDATLNNGTTVVQ